MKRYLFILILSLLLPSYCLAMSSANYRIDSDVVGSGGNASSSGSYNLGDTLGEPIIGGSSSLNYEGYFGFWHMMPSGSQLGLSCEASDVYMADYTLGDANNYSKYLFSTSEECIVTDNSSAPWTLTINSTNFTSSKNSLSNANVYLATDGTVGSGDTITSPTTEISESAGPEYSLNSTRTIISGTASASGEFNNRPTMVLKNLNTLYDEDLAGTITITIQ